MFDVLFKVYVNDIMQYVCRHRKYWNIVVYDEKQKLSCISTQI